MFRRYVRSLMHGHAREDGFAVIMMAACLPVFFGIAALLVDMGHAYSEKRHLQNAADAAALAAGVYLPSTDPGVLSQAQSAAIELAAKNGVTITAADVTFSSTSVTNDTAHVATYETVKFFFGPAVNLSSTAVQPHAVAQIGRMSGARGVLPFGMTVPTGGFVFGQKYCLKLAALGTCATGTPSNFQIMDADDTGNSSASYYSGLIVSGSLTVVREGQIKNVVTGDKSGPTQQGIGCTGNNGRLTGNTQTFADVVQTNADGSYTVLDWSSPRLALIPLITVLNSAQVQITGFAVFFIDDCGPKASVVGQFIDTVVPNGVWAPYMDGSDFGSRAVRLVN